MLSPLPNKKAPSFIGLFHDPGIFGLTQGLRSTPCRWAFLFVRGLKACSKLFQAQFCLCMLSPLPNKKAPSAFAEKALCPGLDSNQHTSRRRHLKTVRLPISPPGPVSMKDCKYNSQNYAFESFLDFKLNKSMPIKIIVVPIICSKKIDSPKI